MKSKYHKGIYSIYRDKLLNYNFISADACKYLLNHTPQKIINNCKGASQIHTPTF